jgi:hypothetical protein
MRLISTLKFQRTSPSSILPMISTRNLQNWSRFRMARLRKCSQDVPTSSVATYLKQVFPFLIFFLLIVFSKWSQPAFIIHSCYRASCKFFNALRFLISSSKKLNLCTWKFAKWSLDNMRFSSVYYASYKIGFKSIEFKKNCWKSKW